MILGVYVKNKPKSKWHLVSVTDSPESANIDLDQARKQSTLEGYDNAEAAIRSFDSAFYIPVFLVEVKESKPLYN